MFRQWKFCLHSDNPEKECFQHFERSAHFKREHFCESYKIAVLQRKHKGRTFGSNPLFFIFWPCGTQNMSECVFQPKYLVILTESLLCTAISKKKKNMWRCSLYSQINNYHFICCTWYKSVKGSQSIPFRQNLIGLDNDMHVVLYVASHLKANFQFSVKKLLLFSSVRHEYDWARLCTAENHRESGRRTRRTRTTLSIRIRISGSHWKLRFL